MPSRPPSRYHHRKRPILLVTVDPEVELAVRARATAAKMPLSHMTDCLLRFALGMTPAVEIAIAGAAPAPADVPDATDIPERNRRRAA
jgi:hypothetical protein